MVRDKQTQVRMILEHLQHGGSVTPLQALEEFDCFRLGARIHDIKRIYQLPVKTTIVRDNGKHFSRYSLEITKAEVNHDS